MGASSHALWADYGALMCVQCMMAATTSTAAATGLRAWVATRQWTWLTPVRMRRITVALIGAAIIASAVVMKGSTPAA